MKIELVYDQPSTYRVAAVEQAFKDIAASDETLAASIKEVVRAPGRLVRKGINLLVKVVIAGTHGAREDFIPVRVKTDSNVNRRLEQTDSWRPSWKGRFIQDICLDYCRDFSDVRRKVWDCLRTAINNILRRKRNRNAQKANLAGAKYARNEYGARQREPYRRVHPPQMAFH